MQKREGRDEVHFEKRKCKCTHVHLLENMLLSVIMKKPEWRDRGEGHMATTCGICVFGNDQTPLAGNVRRLRTTRAWKEHHPSKPRFALPWHSRRHWIVRLVKPEIIQKCRTLAAGAGIPPWADVLLTTQTAHDSHDFYSPAAASINELPMAPA